MYAEEMHPPVSMDLYALEQKQHVPVRGRYAAERKPYVVVERFVLARMRFAMEKRHSVPENMLDVRTARSVARGIFVKEREIYVMLREQSAQTALSVLDQSLFVAAKERSVRVPDQSAMTARCAEARVRSV